MKSICKNNNDKIRIYFVSELIVPEKEKFKQTPTNSGSKW